MRLIDADALKAYLRELGWITDDPFAEVGDLEEIIDEIPTIDRPRGEWIPCSERLPDKDGEYIVTLYLEYSKKFIVSLDARFRNHRWEGVRSPVVAWLPLPEPYEKEGEAE